MNHAFQENKLNSAALAELTNQSATKLWSSENKQILLSLNEPFPNYQETATDGWIMHDAQAQDYPHI
jgi:hypothetical protein